MPLLSEAQLSQKVSQILSKFGLGFKYDFGWVACRQGAGCVQWVMRSPRVQVKPELLKWACRRAGSNVSELSYKFKDLPQWVNKEKKPTLKQLENFAKATFVPVGQLFSERPPDESLKNLSVQDFRSLKSRKLHEPSCHLIDTIYLCQQRQNWYHDFLKSEGHQKLNFVASVSTKHSVVQVAQKICRHIKFDDRTRRKASNWEEALVLLRKCIEDSGVLIMINGVVGSNTRRPLQVDEFRGFALADDLAPLIFVNGADAKSAQMFTMAHELAHIWLGNSAVVNVSPDVRSSDQKVEQWCNQVAAEILAPLESIKQEVIDTADIQNAIKKLVQKYKVSSLVILRRLLDAKQITRKLFDEIYSGEELKFSKKNNSRSSRGGGDFYRTLGVRVGQQFMYDLVASTWARQTTFTEAFRLLGIKSSSTFQNISYKIGVRKK